MKIKEKFTTLDAFKRGSSIKRNCFKRCSLCKTEWIKSTSIYVHYSTIMKRNYIEAIFFCDNCLKVKKLDEKISDNRGSK